MIARDAGTFLDSNILLYCVDTRDERKSEIANEIVENLWQTSTGVLSWQVFNEFYSNATKKLRIPALLAQEYVLELSGWQLVPPSLGLVKRAWHWSDQAQLSYWDALIVAAAEQADCSILLTEDLQAGRKFGEKLTVVNPFSEA